MRVHFASGGHPFPKPWWNVDLLPHPGVDERVDLLSDDWGTVGQVDMAYVGHWLEHMTNEEMYTFLYHLRSVMVPRTSVAAFVGPDCDKAKAENEAGRLPDGLLHACLPHGQITGPHRGGVHAQATAERMVLDALWDVGWMARPASWRTLREFGFPVINESAWQYCVVAY